MSTDPARLVHERVRTSTAVLDQLAEPGPCGQIARVAGLVTESLRAGGKLLLFGNGGSAADAQHIATELVSRYLLERRALPAMSLGVNASSLTAIGNDYSFDEVFSRQVEAMCRPEDAVLGISTSGNSQNVIAGVEAARAIGATALGMTGEGGGRLAAVCDECIRVPSADTPRIQEGHILVAHIICEIVEAELAAG
jgi:D-sedoheptulose 7-phosphate isomerase